MRGAVRDEVARAAALRHAPAHDAHCGRAARDAGDLARAGVVEVPVLLEWAVQRWGREPKRRRGAGRSAGMDVERAQATEERTRGGRECKLRASRHLHGRSMRMARGVVDLAVRDGRGDLRRRLDGLHRIRVRADR